MNIVGYVDTINDELDGAKNYIKKAVACKSTHPSWASMYVKMSEAELGHANDNLRIFEDDFSQQEKQTQEVLSDVHDSIIDMYTEQSTIIKMMYQTYSEK